MPIKGLDRLLKEHPFFQNMDPKACEIIAGCATNERYEVGDYMFREGEAADKFYLIRHGAVLLEIDVPGREPLAVDALEDGAILGWAALTPPYRWVYDARVLRLTRLVSLDAACLRGKCESDRVLARELFKRFIPIMADSLAAARRQLIDKARDNPGTRRVLTS